METGWVTPHNREFDMGSSGRKYHFVVLSGRISASVHTVTDRDPGNHSGLDDKCTVSGHPVVDVLHNLHPEVIISEEGDFDHHEATNKCLELMPVFCFEDNAKKATRILCGVAEPCGVHAISMKTWLLRHEVHSEATQERNGTLGLVAEQHLPSLRSLRCPQCMTLHPRQQMSGSTTTSMQRGVDEINGYVQPPARGQFRTVYENMQLCSGLRLVTEGNLLVVRAVWPQSAGWTLEEQVRKERARRKGWARQCLQSRSTRQPTQ